MPTKETTEQRLHRAELALHAIARDPESFDEVQNYLCMSDGTQDLEEGKCCFKSGKDYYVEAWLCLKASYHPDEVEAILASKTIWPSGPKPIYRGRKGFRSWALERITYGREMDTLETKFKAAKAKLRDKYSIAINYWQTINAEKDQKAEQARLLKEQEAIQARLLKEQQEEEELEKEYESRMQKLVEIRDSQKDELDLLRSEL